ncbi:hypothetical protein HYC85_008521 [Camellia sinensis]|uniref:Protein DA1-like domain-containing protein n=1 Tax=Camellia sinensis TaxID=4442 RepID=A0A7J7HT10_CAMSI|nr:hypothetical protein HYC85_008521 [Camellia sinensis]
MGWLNKIFKGSSHKVSEGQYDSDGRFGEDTIGNGPSSSGIPTNAAGLIEYRAHPFWVQKYCPVHENDGTPRCCSCERMEPRETRYVALDDGRKLCLECLDSAIMDTNECQPLNIDIREFYEGLNMKVEQQVPLLLVERQALNEAMDGERSVRQIIIV